MPNPTQSPAETNGLQIKPGTRILHQHGGYGVITRRNPQPFGDGKGAWMVRYDDRPDVETPALEMFMTVEPVSPAAAVSDLCDACGAVACKSKDGHETCGSSVGPLRFCAACWNSRDSFHAAVTRRRALAEPGFKVGDEVVVHGCNAAGGYWNGKTGTIEAPRRTAGSGFNVAMGAQGSVHFETKELRLIRAALAEAARTGEARLYGTQPDVLPETLPAGTKSTSGDVATETLARTVYAGKPAYEMRGRCWTWTTDFVDWTTVPLPPATAGGEQTNRNARHCDKCMNPAVTGATLCREHVASLGKPIEAAERYPNVGFVPFDQRASGIDAAIRLSKLEQAKALLARPIRTGPLRDRDKYGQRVSLRGWETDDE